MAPLPENSTTRVYIDYTAGGQAHTMQLRFDDGLTTDWATAANEVIVEMLPMMYTTDSVTGVRYSPVGSNLSFPLPGVTTGSGANVTAFDPDLKPNFISFTGRSLDGRDVRVTFFSPIFNLKDSGYRGPLGAGDVAALFSAITSTEPNVTTISGGQPLWHAYVNYGSNAYFQRKARRT